MPLISYAQLILRSLQKTDEAVYFDAQDRLTFDYKNPIMDRAISTDMLNDLYSGSRTLQLVSGGQKDITIYAVYDNRRAGAEVMAAIKSLDHKGTMEFIERTAQLAVRNLRSLKIHPDVVGHAPTQSLFAPLFAEAVAKRFGVPCVFDIARKIDNTVNLAAHHVSLRPGIALNNTAINDKNIRREVKGTVLICDDFTTSNATIMAVANRLLSAKGKDQSIRPVLEVVGLAIAKSAGAAGDFTTRKSSPILAKSMKDFDKSYAEFATGAAMTWLQDNKNTFTTNQWNFLRKERDDIIFQVAKRGGGVKDIVNNLLKTKYDKNAKYKKYD